MKKIIKNTFALCIPLTAPNMDDLILDHQKALRHHPDFIEWRRDAIQGPIDDVAVLRTLRERAPGTGIIYTYRSPAEGGLTQTDEQTRLAAVKTVLASGLCDYIDTELANAEADLDEIDRAKQNTKTGLILSYHHFQKTPEPNELSALLEKMDSRSPDVIKIALTAARPADVRRAASVVLPFSERTDKPIIFTMMREGGAVIRAVPELFGGSITFAASEKASAPGQLTPSEIQTIRHHLHAEDAPGQPSPAPEDHLRQNIALIGYMGTGKTTVSRRLSQMTGMPRIDTDERVEALAGKTISDIFEQDGEAAFRLLEHIVLRDALKTKGQIIATGGGIVLREDNRALLKNNAFTVHLTASPDVIAKRLAGDTTRPLLSKAADLRTKIQNMLEERQPFYSGYALTVTTDNRSAEDIAKQILAAYHCGENK